MHHTFHWGRSNLWICIPYFAVYYHISSFFLQLQCKKFNAYNITDHLTFCYCRNPGRKKLSRENIWQKQNLYNTLSVILGRKHFPTVCSWIKCFYSPALKKWGLYWICPVLPSFCHNSDETWISLRPVGQSWSNFIWSISMMGKGLHKVLGQLGSKLWFPWQQKAPIDF